jgi:hypothetical protein
MKGATQKWIVGSMIAGMSLAMGSTVASAADVTDADRVFRNYTRETATVAQGQIRVEVRGLQEQDDQNTKLNLLGFRVKDVDRVTGGIVDLVGSYGFAKNAEVGFIIPGYIESLRFTDGSTSTNEDVGDFLLYGKFQQSVAEHCRAGAGLELTTPNGPESKGFGTGELGVNPFVSTRYAHGPWALGLHAGYNFYSGDVDSVFNYSIEGIVRGSEAYAIRTEWSGRLFTQGGQRIWDAVFLPGIDFNVTDNLTIRPTGLANSTKDALDWGIGIGVAATF